MLSLPQYPVFIPSKGRMQSCLTAQACVRDSVPFFLVVEPQEFEAYAERFGREHVLRLPFRDTGSVIAARNWIKDHATAAGHLRHWQLDDNIRGAYRVWNGKRRHCRLGVGLRVCEDFTDRYENIAISGLNYDMFVIPEAGTIPPFVANCHVYSCSLILNSRPTRWRGHLNEDTDYCLQVLADGWCTVLINAFCVKKQQTMVAKGGNTPSYQGDGRLRMARSLVQNWPHVVTVKRRFQRPQHVVRDSWRKFDTPLRLKAGIDLAAIPPNDYGLTLIP
jgi:hypothetical protein